MPGKDWNALPSPQRNNMQMVIRARKEIMNRAPILPMILALVLIARPLGLCVPTEVACAKAHTSADASKSRPTIYTGDDDEEQPDGENEAKKEESAPSEVDGFSVFLFIVAVAVGVVAWRLFNSPPIYADQDPSPFRQRRP